MRKSTGRKLFWWLFPFVIVGILAFSFKHWIWKAILPDLENFRLAQLDFEDDSVRVKLELSIFNKGILKIDVIHTELRAYDDTVLLFTYSNDSIHVLKSGERSVAVLYMTLPIQKIMERIREHQDKDSIGIRLKGEVHCSTVFGDMATHVDTVFTVRVPVPPKMYVREVDYLGKDGPKAHTTALQLEFVNNNPRELTMSDINYELYSTRFATMSGHLDELNIAAMDSTLVEVPGKVEGIGVLGLITRIILDNDVVDYRFVMTGTLKSLTGVVAYDVPVTIHSRGSFELYNRNREHMAKLKIVGNRNK